MTLVLFVFRVEYDAYRSDLEALQAAPRAGDATAAQKLEDAQQRYQSHKEKFERLRSDVSVKMKFLDENRVIDAFSSATAIVTVVTFDSFRQSLKSHLFGDRSAW